MIINKKPYCRWCEQILVVEDAYQICDYDGERLHEVAPQYVDCEGCGNEISFTGNEYENLNCVSCQLQDEREIRDMEWSYRQ
jgi:hypothetical protein